MESNNDNMEGGVNFKWTNEYYKIFCDLCIKFIRKNGWDAATGKLSASNEWWERKLKEEPKAVKFRYRGVDPVLEEMWKELFDDTYATGENVVAPSMDPNYARQRERENVNVDEGDNENGGEEFHHFKSFRDHVYSEYNRYASRMDSLLHDEQAFFSDFIQEVGNTEVPSQGVGGAQVPNQGDHSSVHTQTQNMSNNSAKGKRKRRQSGGATKLSSQIDTLVSNSSKALGKLG
ncbi:hypothetical protein SESBI_08140 [Sesbania bispinosa]|nr:hypothetical protein SESBI_08140 [Sesbania bispinosa]